MNRSATWEAANVTKRRKSALSSPSRTTRAEADRATLEAMLNRLSRAYNTAMECIGALHRADSAAGSADVETWTVLCRVARAARRTLEDGILTDALVGPHAAAVWTAGVQQFAPKSSWTWMTRVARVSHQARPQLTSAQQEQTVQQIAYLALVNYADLLWACCGTDTQTFTTQDDSVPGVLDRGIVTPLKALQHADNTVNAHQSNGCWNDDVQDRDGDSAMHDTATPSTNDNKCRESLEQTLQLIVWALIDATSLDGSDPLVWLKLACACRRLGLVQGNARRYRLLERHALEQGIAARPQTPNRKILQAYQEWQRAQEAQHDAPCDTLAPPLPLAMQRLSIPRYSWAVLGRILLRSCRGETHPSSLSKPAEHVSVELAPLLALPTDAVLQPIISFLDPRSYSQLKQVCRTLSTLRFEASKPKGETACAGGITQQPAGETSTTTTTAAAPTAATATTAPPAAAGAAPPPQPLTKASKSVSASSKESAPGSRVSKRLRSQIITSGKRAERSHRRSSVDYCVYAIVLGTAPPTHNPEEKEEAHNKPVLPPDQNDMKQASTRFSDSVIRPSVLSEKEQRRREAEERIGTASLTSFVHAFQDQSRPPLALLFSYAAHVSVYADQVFLSDHHGTMILLSSVTDCFDVMLKRTRSYQGLTPAWSTKDYQIPAGVDLEADQVLAIDILHAELRFKRCDREDQHVTEVNFDSDANMVERLIPAIGTQLEEVPNTSIPKRQWNALRVRYEWLVAGYYLWRSRISHDVAESREAEQEGLECIKDIIPLMEELGVARVPTPHLDGIGRSGEVWKELSISSLTAFQNKVQASSVVLKAQEHFIDAVSKLNIVGDDLTTEERNRFVDISSYLLERYSSPVDSPESNFVELLDDFMGVHGTAIALFSLASGATEIREWFANVIPVQEVTREALKSMTQPCILSILLCCMQLREEPSRTLVVLLNLIRTLERYQRRVLESAKGEKFYEDEPHTDAMSDDLSLMSEDENPDSGNTSTLSGYACLLGLLVEAMEIVFNKSDAATRAAFVSSSDVRRGIEEIFSFCSSQPLSTWHGGPGSATEFDSSVTQFILERLSALLRSIETNSSISLLMIKHLRLSGLTSILLNRETSLKTLLEAPIHQKSRPWWRSHVTTLAKEIGYVCISLGELCSNDLAKVEDGTISESSLIEGAKLSIERLVSSLLSLFHFARSKLNDVPIKDLLSVPVGAALVGLCGTAASTRSNTELSVALIDFVDSDESAAEWIDDEDGDPEQIKYERTLRVVTQIVHLIQLTVGSEEDRALCTHRWFHNYVTDHGPLVPLTACRVLSFCADTLLEEFEGDASGLGLRSSLWTDYSVGTRKVGSMLDALLHKVYRCMHGFNLSSTADTKDGTHVSTSDSTLPSFLPEGVKAAAQLYRCVMRTSGFGRKSPPKTALDTIQAALPEVSASVRSQKIRNSLFRAKAGHFELGSLVSAAQKGSAWEEYFSPISDSFDVSSDDLSAHQEEESSLVRQGIAHLIAQGPLPQYQDTPDTDVRVETGSVEIELCKKFNAILFELSYGNVANCKNWVKAAQCCWTKAEMIADRIGKQKKFVQSRDFVVRGPIRTCSDGLPLADLIAQQEREDGLRVVGWTEVVGHDLSVYMDHSWSSFESLKEFSRALESQFREATEKSEDLADSIQTYEEITKLFREERFDMWQQSWGGVFVSALRSLARRCMGIALFVSYKELDKTIEKGDERLAAEICESIGTFLYSEVSGSQIYGYPMRPLTQCRKRSCAEMAAAFYNESLSLQKKNTKRDKDEVSADWDILFMIGKCHEKIASTFIDESFKKPGVGATDSTGIRRYEIQMQKALDLYAESLDHGLKLEKDGALIAEQQGGSGHGATEVQYRVHATRLKCLINALKANPADRDAADQEALRLIEKTWYTKSPPDRSCEVRDRAWNVLTDVVDAMIQCRSEYSCFHRSVYRHAQALLWAPLVCDPLQPEGSFGDVPGHRAYKLRGLNSGSAVESAASVIGSLFDRRRAQLCAVWVTQGAAEAFEQINVSVRKYDSLRGKYIAAYLETLELGHHKNDLETFWRWVSSGSRDLPSYMHVTAGGLSRPRLEKLKFDKIKKHHANDALIITSRPPALHHFLADVKRRTNAALAVVILHEVKNLKPASKVSESHLKQVYSCFLRLNCDPSDLHKARVRKSSSVRPIVEGLMTVYTQLVPSKERPNKGESTMEGDWSQDGQEVRLIDLALGKCRELFPSLSNSFLSSKKAAPARKKRGAEDLESSDGPQVFRVSVPEGLAEGDTFLTEITVDGTKKRLRLTVPKGGATTLRFTLGVPQKKGDGPPAKQQKTDT